MKNQKILFVLLAALCLSGCLTTYSALDESDTLEPGKAYLACYIPKRGDSYFMLYDLDAEDFVEIELEKREFGLQVIEIPAGNYALQKYVTSGYRSTTTYVPPVDLMRLYCISPNDVVFLGKWGVEIQNNHPVFTFLFGSGGGSYDIEYDVEQARQDLLTRFGSDARLLTFRTLDEF